MIFRAILCNIREEHTSISFEVNLNSKLQIALDVIKNQASIIYSSKAHIRFISTTQECQDSIYLLKKSEK